MQKKTATKLLFQTFQNEKKKCDVEENLWLTGMKKAMTWSQKLFNALFSREKVILTKNEEAQDEETGNNLNYIDGPK